MAAVAPVGQGAELTAQVSRVPLPTPTRRDQDSDTEKSIEKDGSVVSLDQVIPEQDLGPSLKQWSVFDDPELAKNYLPPSTWENYHRFDINARWTAEEERKLVQKCDWRIALFVCFCFFGLQLDRGNIGSANADNFLKDIGADTNQFNYGQTLFLCSFLAAELPSQIISKKLGVDVWVPIQMMAWSLVAIMQCRIKNVTGFYITRSLLGLLEGGFIPDMILYLSYFYTRHEFPVRLSYFWISLGITTIIGTFLAAAILPMRGLHGWEGWRYLFLIEGIITFVIGLFAAFWFPAGPTQTAGGIRGKKGWFTEREETILVTRILREDPTKSDMHNREGLTPSLILDALWEYDLWPLYAVGLVAMLPVTTVNMYFTLVLRSLGFSAFRSNILQLPYQIATLFTNWAIAHFSQRVKERTYVSLIHPVWVLVCMIALVCIPDAGAWSKYALFVVLLSYPMTHPILVAWVSNNSGSVKSRTVSASLYNIMTQTGSIVASNVYRKDDAPKYKRGNKILLGIVVIHMVTLLFVKAYYLWKNKTRSAKWESLTPAERQDYLTNTKDVGNKRLDFRFEH